MTSAEKHQPLAINELLESVASAMPANNPLAAEQQVGLERLGLWSGRVAKDAERQSTILPKVAEMGKKTGEWVFRTIKAAVIAAKTAHDERRRAQVTPPASPAEQPKEVPSFFDSIFVPEPKERPAGEEVQAPAILDLAEMQLLPVERMTGVPTPVRRPSQEIALPDMKLRAAELVYEGTLTGEIKASSLTLFSPEITAIVRREAAKRGIYIVEDLRVVHPTSELQASHRTSVAKKGEPMNEQKPKKSLKRMAGAITIAAVIAYGGSNILMRDIVCKDQSPLAIMTCGGGKFGDAVTKNIPVLSQILSAPSIVMDGVYKFLGQKER